MILQILTKIIKELFLHPDMTVNIERLILIGGETSFHILKALHTRTVSIFGKIENGIDYGFVRDGIIKGKEFLIKGGSVGNEQAITRMICHSFSLAAVD